MRLLSWNEFNSCVTFISNACREKTLSGVYGVPRGGLCLAVAISHALQIPFLETPQINSLVIDDVYQTGETLNQFRYIKGVIVFVWLSKVEPVWWNAIEVTEKNEWLVFPWENPLLASADEKHYLASRLPSK